MSILGRGTPNRPIVIRNDLADPPVLTTAPPVVETGPPASIWFSTHPVLQTRSSFEDSSDFNSHSQTTVITRQPDTKYNGGFSYSTRNTLQDPPVLTTPGPVVISGSSSLYFNKSFNQVSVAPFIAPSTTGPTTIPQVLTAPPAATWFDVGSPTTVRNTLQDPPVLTTPQPTVISGSSNLYFSKNFNQAFAAPSSAPVAPGAPTPGPIIAGVRNVGQWFDIKPAQVIDNVQLGIPTQASPDPIVISGPRSLLYQPTRTIIIDNVQLGTTSSVVRPVCFSGTVADENSFTGIFIDDLVLSGNVVGHLILSGAIVDENTFTGTMKGWCMQEVDITAGEFNDESWDFTINAGSPPSPFNITGLTLEMYFKTAAGVSDTDPSTVKITTPTDITITSGPAGQGTASLPSTNLQNNNLGFYRLDVLQSSKRHTALYGKVGITLL